MAPRKHPVRSARDKNTHPGAASRREPQRAKPAAERMRVRRKLDAHPDRVDVRDWIYQPTLAALPDRLVNCQNVPLVLDQGSEGACTGFALAAVINYHLSARKLERRVSAHMLYSLARRYDEWPGESYDGSSARGAMKGWVAHGVCAAKSWSTHADRALNEALAREAQLTPGGAYYRVLHRNIRDMHAALAEVGILYATLMVHDGWDEPGPATIEVPLSMRRSGAAERLPRPPLKSKNLQLPIIRRKGRADSGHAVAIVGYTELGFIIQNSWGPKWGARGFALLPYEDYMLHATDVWVAQLGVPISLHSWTNDGADQVSGLHRAARAIPLSDIRPYIVDIGNNGELSRSGTYWTSEEDVRRLFQEVIPAQTKDWPKRRVALYLHGGLNDEKAVAERVIAYRDVMLANHIYPLHIMWESGVWETLNGMLNDVFSDVDERAGSVADWVHKLRDGLIEAKDRSFELTVAGPGGALWREMKENARLASHHPDGRGGMHIVAKHAAQALQALAPAERKRWEMHVIGHSAGSIFAAHALPHLVALGASFKSLQLMAPAISIEDFKKLVLPHVTDGSCPLPTLYMLSDAGELDDDVGPYGKSLLYLVSNAFEKQRAEPLLGMARFLVRDAEGGKEHVDKQLQRLYAKKIDGRAALVLAGASQGAGSSSESDSHGGFDNDVATMNSVLQRILHAAPERRFTLRDLQFDGKSGSSPQVQAPRLSAKRVASLRNVPANTQLPGRLQRIV